MGNSVNLGTEKGLGKCRKERKNKRKNRNDRKDGHNEMNNKMEPGRVWERLRENAGR